MSIYCVALCLKTTTSLSLTEKFVLLALCEKADNDGTNAFPSVETLSRYAECSPRTVQRSLHTLVKSGWIRVAQKATPRRPTNYSISLNKFEGCQPVTPRVTSEVLGGDTAMSSNPIDTTHPIVVNGLDIQSFIAFWIDSYKKHRLGAKYQLNKSRDIAIIKRLVKSYGLKRLQDMATVFLTTDESFIESTDRSLVVFQMKAMWLDHLLRKHGR